jgi:hypothetical protein
MFGFRENADLQQAIRSFYEARSRPPPSATASPP